MKQTRILNAIIITIAIGALFGALLLRSHKKQPPISAYTSARLVAGDHSIPLSIAETEAAREQGLSGTLSLAKGTGKLFIFDTSGKYGFWMKDMHYALDLVWIDSNQTIIGITPNVTPETYPSVFFPPAPVHYVLEINADEASTDGLSTGMKVNIERNL